MTDRELPAPADRPRPPTRPRIAPLTDDPNTTAHQEPAPRADGPPMSVTIATRPHPRTPAPDAARALLSRLFAGHELPTFASAQLRAAPGGPRAPAEALAAARAAACPDLFLAHAPDPLAGERVIADTARAAAVPVSGRVLVLSPNPAAADRITERLVRSADVSTVRALADDENPARPSPAVARVTSAALAAARVDQLKREVAAAVGAADARLAALDRLTEL